MKKTLSILLLTLILSGCASQLPKVPCVDWATLSFTACERTPF